MLHLYLLKKKYAEILIKRFYKEFCFQVIVKITISFIQWKKNDVTQPLYHISNCTAISCNNGIEHKVECQRQMKMCY